MNDLTVVSGCPRSGTSMMMDALHHAMPERALVGDRFPQAERLAALTTRGDGESAARFAARQYMARQDIERLRQTDEHARRMNPNGFWECRYTVRGLQWHVGMDLPERGLIKIVSQGLARSDPRYIGKVVMMCREPRQVAKSQEDLQRAAPVDLFGQGVRVNSPQMFIRVTVAAARWLVEFPGVPVMLVPYEQVMVRPIEMMAAIVEFLGEGDAAAAAARIDPALHRNREAEDPAASNDERWAAADDIYRRFMARDFAGVIEAAEHHRDTINKEAAAWFCPRLGMRVGTAVCGQCMTNETVQRNMIHAAEGRGIDWAREPCLYECGFDAGRAAHLTIEQSIERNHWLAVDARKTPCIHRGDEVERRACETCKGKAGIAVFECQVHGQCTIKQHFEGVAHCLRCDDYQAGPTTD